MSLYDLLGVNKDASEKEVKAAYKKRAKETHPDKNGNADDEEFQSVSAAYAVLSNPASRDRYDRTGNVEDSDPFARLLATANQFFMMVIAENSDVVHLDLIEGCLEKLQEAKGTLIKNRVAQQANMDHLEVVLSRLNFRGEGENFLAVAVKSQIEGHKRNLENIKEERLHLEEVRKFFEDYDYDYDITEQDLVFPTEGTEFNLGR